MFMDGQETDGVICDRGEEEVTWGVYTSAYQFAEFQFADVITTGA